MQKVCSMWGLEHNLNVGHSNCNRMTQEKWSLELYDEIKNDYFPNLPLNIAGTYHFWGSSGKWFQILAVLL